MNWGCSNVHGTNEEIDIKIKRKLKFQHECDILRFRSCIDLIEDTESAITYFSVFGLEKFSRKIGKNFGEMYIKLYGILNAVYLQLNAIIEIYEICKILNKKDIVSKFRNHRIFELRNIMGAHTSNFEDKSDYMPPNFSRNSFRITQMQLNAKGNNLHAVDSFGNLKEFDLYDIVMSYNMLSERILYDGCNEYMSRIFSNSTSRKTELLTHYELTEFENYNYRKLYKNDKLYRNYIKRIRNRIDMETPVDFDMDEFIADDLLGLVIPKDYKPRNI
jgi:hypothetical protein